MTSASKDFKWEAETDSALEGSLRSLRSLSNVLLARMLPLLSEHEAPLIFD